MVIYLRVQNHKKTILIKSTSEIIGLTNSNSHAYTTSFDITTCVATDAMI